MAEVLLTQAEKNGFVEFHHFMKKKTEQLKQKFSKLVGKCGFLYTANNKACGEISLIRLRHVDFLHSFSIYPQESKNNTVEGRKSNLKIVTIASRS